MMRIMWECVLFCTLLAFFCLPGYLVARRLNPETKVAFCIASGFVYSLGIFSVIAWPCLWLHADATAFGIVASLSWAALLFVALMMRSRSRQVRAEVNMGVPLVTTAAAPAHRQRGFVSERTGAIVLLLFLGAIGLVAAEVSSTMTMHHHLSASALLTLGIWLAIGTTLFPVLKLVGSSAARPVPSYRFRLFALIAIGVPGVGVALVARPEWDDTYYLAAIRQYSGAGELNREDPTLPKEGFPVACHQRLLSWELLTATFCRYSGISPLSAYYTLLPPFLVLLVFAANWQLLEQCVPRSLVPLAIVGISTYWLLCNSAFQSPGHYLLTRSSQGKSILWHLALPVVTSAHWQFIRKPKMRAWGACVFSCLGAMGMSSSAVFMVPILVLTFSFTMCVWGKVRRPWHVYAASIAPAGFVAPYAVLMYFALQTNPVLTIHPRDAQWHLYVLRTYVEYGGSEIVWLLALPVLAVLVKAREARAFLVALPCLLCATVLNPVCFQTVATHVTSFHVYHRLFWLLPISQGIGVCIALGAEQLAHAVTYRARWSGVLYALAVVLLCGALGGLPDRYVWHSDTEHPSDERFRTAWAENMAKLPSDLVPIIEQAENDADVHYGRFLVPGHLSQYFLALIGDRKYVCSRRSYTVEALTAVAASAQGYERVSLAREFLRGEMAGIVARKLLDKYSVTMVVTDREGESARVAQQLQENGFTLCISRGPYCLWKRAADRCAAKSESEVIEGSSS